MDRGAWWARVAREPDTTKRLAFSLSLSDDCECHSTQLSAICILSLMKYLFKSSAHVRWVACLIITEWKSSFYILDISLLSDLCLANIFSPQSLAAF